MYKTTAFLNGRIHTSLGIMEALLIEGGCITVLGADSDVLPRVKGTAAETVDLKGKTVLPGFCDSHMHLMAWAESQEILDLTECGSIGDIQAALRSYIASNPAPGSWYRGRGWNQTRMGGRVPTRRDLDSLSPDNPVILTRVCGHVAVLNTAALRLAGITRDTRVEGGVIELDGDGEPSGVLAEGAAVYVYRQIPKLRDEDMRRLLKKYGPQAAGFGLTQLNTDDLGAFDRDFRRAVKFYTDAERDGILPFRVRQQFMLPQRELLLDFLSEGWRTGDGTPLYQIGPLKLICDGSLGGRTAFLRREYADVPGERGLALFGQEDLNELAAIAHSSGMQIAAHAIGDGALDMCLDAIEAAQAGSREIIRHEIVHAQIADDRQIDRMKSLRVGAAIQPSFAPSDREMAAERLGGRAARSYRWKRMLNRGVALGGGSDAPIESLRPLYGIHAAVTRQGQDGEPDGGWMPEERLSVAEAIALYTWGNAWLAGSEKRRGEIAPGRDADLTVLEQDPFLTPAADLWKIGVAMTLCGGRITYRRSDVD